MLQRKLTIVGTMKKCRREIPECMKLQSLEKRRHRSLFSTTNSQWSVTSPPQKKSCDTVKYDAPRNKHWRRRPQKETRGHQVLPQDEDRCWPCWSNGWNIYLQKTNSTMAAETLLQPAGCRSAKCLYHIQASASWSAEYWRFKTPFSNRSCRQPHFAPHEDKTKNSPAPESHKRSHDEMWLIFP